MKRALAAMGLVLGAAGCVIIINPGGDNPTPQPVPLACTPSAIDSPIVHVYFTARIERSTVNLADRYGKIMGDTVLGLASLGANVTTGVLVRQDERPVSQPLLAAWGCTLDNPMNLAPADVIRWYATESELGDDVNLGCAIDPLIEMGEKLTDTVTQYPVSSTGGRLNGTSGLSVFNSAPDLVLVVHLDALGRKTSFDEAGCARAAGAITADQDGNAPWLDYAGAVPHDHIVHWFFTTEELVSREQFVSSCKGVDGFPSSVLDTLEESKKAFYGPLSEALKDRGESVAGLPMCRALVELEERTFLAGQLSGIAGTLGLTFDEQRFKDVLNGGFEALLNPGSTSDDAGPFIGR